MKPLQHYIQLLMFTSGVVFTTQAQYEEDSSSSIGYVYSSISAQNNVGFAGRLYQENTLNLTSDVSFFHTSGFYVGVNSWYYPNEGTNWRNIGFNTGYSNFFDSLEQFSYDIGYSKSFFFEEVDTLTSSFDINLGYQNKKGYFGSRISYSYLFGNDRSFQLMLSSYFDVNIINKPLFGMSISPEIKMLYTPYNQVNSEYDGTKKVGLVNRQIGSSINLVTNKWDLELGYYLNLPKLVEGETDVQVNGTFSFTLGYLINL